MFIRDRESVRNSLCIMQRQHCSYDMMSVNPDTTAARPAEIVTGPLTPGRLDEIVMEVLYGTIW